MSAGDPLPKSFLHDLACGPILLVILAISVASPALALRVMRVIEPLLFVEGTYEGTYEGEDTSP